MILAVLTGIASTARGETPSTPPEDGKLSYLQMDCKMAYGESLGNIVEMTTSGKEVWMKNFIESGYMHGEIQDNGDIRFYMPQYMGLNGNSALNIYAVNSKDNQQLNQFDLLIQENGNYVMEEGIELWGGEEKPEYRLISNAKFTPIEVYTGSPAPPSNAKWSEEYDNCFEFDLSFKGENGEDLPTNCMYWQALINDEPYVAKIPDFMGGEISVIPATMWLYEDLPNSDEILEWGQIGEGKYRCYIPQYSPEDVISVRTGYKIGDNPIQWSKSVKVGDDSSEGEEEDEGEDEGKVNESPQGETSQYLSACNYSWNISNGWSYSSTMVQDVAFEDGKLFIDKVCGSKGWIVGDVNEENGYAVFKSPQKVEENSAIYAFYENGSEEVNLDEFFFDFTEDKNEIKLRDADGHPVILKLVFNGMPSIWWSNIVLNRWNETPATPPEDGDISYLKMDCMTAYGESLGNIVEATTSGKDVWMKNLIENRCLHGETLDNGNIRFSMPQYMGLNGNFILYTYSIKNNQQVNQFDLVLQEDGGYVMEDGIELWGGELGPEYRLISSAKFTPVDVYTGTPAPPSNVKWSEEYDNCFEFDLSFKGENGEDLPIGCMYWQALINGEPYVAKMADVENGEISVIPATMYLYEYIPSSGEILEWGQIGEGKYRCYLSQYSPEDIISVRAGYKIGDNPVQWSEAIKVGSTSSIKEKYADAAVKFVDGAFVAADGGKVEVFNLSGMKLDNRSLTRGTYIVVAGGKARKMLVK